MQEEKIKPKKQASEFIKRDSLKPFTTGTGAQNIVVVPRNVTMLFTKMRVCGFLTTVIFFKKLCEDSFRYSHKRLKKLLHVSKITT